MIVRELIAALSGMPQNHVVTVIDPMGRDMLESVELFVSERAQAIGYVGTALRVTNSTEER